MTKFYNKLKKPWFWPILDPFSQCWKKKIFLRKSGSVMHNFIWVSSTMPNFRKNLWYNYKKMPGQKDWWKDGRTDRPYFIGPFRLPPRVQKLTDMKTYIWTQDQHCHLSMLVPQIEYLYYPLNVEGVTQTGSLLPAHKGKTNNNNIKIYICQSQFSVLLDKNKNQLKLLFYPLVPPNFWN